MWRGFAAGALVLISLLDLLERPQSPALRHVISLMVVELQYCGRAAQPCYTFRPVALSCLFYTPSEGKRAAKQVGCAREVGLSQNGVELLAFGSTSVFELVKFVWWMKQGIS